MEPLEIKILLMRAGVTQSEIARRCGVTLAQVQRVIKGDVSFHIREEIAKTVGKDVSELWPAYYRKSEDVQTSNV